MQRTRYGSCTEGKNIDFCSQCFQLFFLVHTKLLFFIEDYQAEVYERQLSMLSDQPTVRGLSPWVLKDFRAPLRMYQGVQDYWNRKGLVSESGERKLAFSVLADHYRMLAAAE